MAISAMRYLLTFEPFVANNRYIRYPLLSQGREMDKLYSSILILFGSIIKFSMGALTAIAYNLGLEGSLANIIGGIIGIVLFTYMGSFIQDYFVRKYPWYFKRRFTASNRFLVRVKQRFGLNGIALITPVILSIPVGVLVALTLTHNKKRIVVSMVFSLLFWGAIIFVPYLVWHINVVDIIRNWFE